MKTRGPRTEVCKMKMYFFLPPAHAPVGSLSRQHGDWSPTWTHAGRSCGSPVVNLWYPPGRSVSVHLKPSPWLRTPGAGSLSCQLDCTTLGCYLYHLQSCRINNFSKRGKKCEELSNRWHEWHPGISLALGPSMTGNLSPGGHIQPTASLQSLQAPCFPGAVPRSRQKSDKHLFKRCFSCLLK